MKKPAFSVILGIAVAAGLLITALTVCAEIETAVLKKVDLKDSPKDITISRDGTTAYILGKKNILVYDLRAGDVTDRIPVSEPFSQVAVSPDGESLLLTDAAGQSLTVMEISPVFDIPAGASPVLGSEKAPVTVTAFLDIQCPYCARVYPTLEKLLKKHSDTVKLVVKHFPLRMHKFANKASCGALAASRQGKYGEMLGLLFENYKKLNDDSLDKFARDLGLDMQKFGNDIEDSSLKQQIRADMGLGRSVRVRGVPAIFVNGRRAKKRSLNDLSAMVRKELGR